MLLEYHVESDTVLGFPIVKGQNNTAHGKGIFFTYVIVHALLLW